MTIDRDMPGRLADTTAGGAPEPGRPADNRSRHPPPAWKRGLAWSGYALAMLVVIGVAVYAFV
jgi:hypothetical protein